VVHDLALVVGDVIEQQQLLADVEVVRSTLRCAFSICRESMPLSMTSPAFMPAICSQRLVRAGSPKMRIRLSSIDR
jgi:hypothetical protein